MWGATEAAALGGGHRGSCAGWGGATHCTGVCVAGVGEGRDRGGGGGRVGGGRRGGGRKNDKARVSREVASSDGIWQAEWLSGAVGQTDGWTHHGLPSSVPSVSLPRTSRGTRHGTSVRFGERVSSAAYYGVNTCVCVCVCVCVCSWNQLDHKLCLHISMETHTPYSDDYRLLNTHFHTYAIETLLARGEFTIRLIAVLLMNPVPSL